LMATMITKNIVTHAALFVSFAPGQKDNVIEAATISSGSTTSH
jgi:hypothetical protein